MTNAFNDEVSADAQDVLALAKRQFAFTFNRSSRDYVGPSNNNNNNRLQSPVRRCQRELDGHRQLER